MKYVVVGNRVFIFNNDNNIVEVNKCNQTNINKKNNKTNLDKKLTEVTTKK